MSGLTVIECDKVITEFLKHYHVSGAEAIINSIVFASMDNEELKYIDKNELINIIDNAYEFYNDYKKIMGSVG